MQQQQGCLVSQEERRSPMGLLGPNPCLQLSCHAHSLVFFSAYQSLQRWRPVGRGILRWMAAAVLALLHWRAVEGGTSSFAEDNTEHTREAREDMMGASHNIARSG